MICRSCGQQSTGAFCGHCGQPLTTQGQWPGWNQGSSRATPYGTPHPNAAPQPSPRRRNNTPFTVIAAVLGLAAVGAGSWLGVSELTKSKQTPTANPSVSVSSSSPTSTSTSSGTPTASSAAATPSATPSTDTAEQQAASTLSSQAGSDLNSVSLDGDEYVPLIATKWVGLTTEEHPSPYTAQDIKAEFDQDKSRFSNVKILKANAVGKQNSMLDAHPDAYVIFVDDEQSSFDDIKQWCASNMSTDQNDCQPLHLAPPHH